MTPSKPFEYGFQVRLADTDAAGVLFCAALFRHAHDAYEAWMAELGHPLDAMIRGGDSALPIVHAEADYRRPMRHGDGIRVEVCVDRLTGRSFTVQYRFLTPDDQPAACARTIHAAIAPATASATALPEELAAKLRALLGELSAADGAAAD